jgi:predicted DNA-binding transcriptional regulator AlpA
LTERLLTIEELAGLLRESPKTTYNRRHRGEGPRGIRPGGRGGRVLFRESDVQRWLESRADPIPERRLRAAR